MPNFFISHSSSDKKLAELIASTLKRITLNQITPWFSSDDSGTGGLQPGMIWFNAIIEKLQKSKAVVAILTPNSISRPWIYFETGIGQTLEGCEIMPICIGMSRDKVYPPLGLYQCYQLSDYHSLREFISKLLSKFDITFDEDMCKSILEKAINQITYYKFEEITEDPKTKELLEDLRKHIDKRFFDLWEKPNINMTGKDLSDKTINIESETDIKKEFSYSISINKNFPNSKSTQFIEIKSSETVSEVLDRIYFLVNDCVDPYEYLETWILRDVKSERLFVIREIMDFIPARFIFRSEFEIEAIPLDEPYNPEMSKERIMNL